jgi:hypothetical protein
MIPPQVGLRLRTLQKEKKSKAKKEKKKCQREKKGRKTEKKKKRKENDRKREKPQRYYLISTLVLQSSTMIFMIESLVCYHFLILVGFFHYRTWSCIPMMGFLKVP